MAGYTSNLRLKKFSVTEYPVAAATQRRALVTRRSHMVGLLLGDIVDPYFAEIVRGIEDVARHPRVVRFATGRGGRAPTPPRRELG